ncbi:hypothetical protein [Aliiroseovarius sp.]
MAHTGAPAEAHFLIDDSAENVTGARRMGWRGHVWSAGDRLEDLLAAGAI